MIVIDGDYPMACGAMVLNRDLTLPIDRIRSIPEDKGTMACLPEMRRGRVAAVVVKICQRVHRGDCPLPGHRSDEQAYAAAGRTSPITKSSKHEATPGFCGPKELQQHIRQWATQD